MLQLIQERGETIQTWIRHPHSGDRLCVTDKHIYIEIRDGYDLRGSSWCPRMKWSTHEAL